MHGCLGGHEYTVKISSW